MFMRMSMVSISPVSLLLLSACSPFFGQERADAIGGGTEADEVSITAVDVDFNPNTTVIPGNRPVTVHLSNNGDLEHNFVVDALDVRVDLPPGTSRTIELEATPGRYTYYCDKFGHRSLGMEGELRVEEAEN